MIKFHSLYFDNPIVDGRVIDIFQPASQSQNTSIFFIHGGGWQAGTRTKFHRIALAYCERGYECASTGYRLQEANVFAQAEDVREGIRIFAEDLRRRGRDAKLLLVAESAGAHLALLAALLADGNHPVTQFISGLALQSAPVTFEPWTDIFPAIWQCMQNAVGQPYHSHPDLYSRASPINLLRPGSPPMFFLEAENEHMFPLEITMRFIDKANQMGIPSSWKVYPRVEHGFFYSLERWQQLEAFEDIAKFANSPNTHSSGDPD